MSIKSGDELQAALNEFTSKAFAEADKTAREAARDLYASLVERTPKRTGRAAAGWAISTGEPAQPPPEGQYPPLAAPQRSSQPEPVAGLHAVVEMQLARLESLPPRSNITIANGTEYIQELEYAQGEQGGFIALSLHEAKKKLENTFTITT